MDAKTLLARCLSLMECEIKELEKQREDLGAISPLAAGVLVDYAKVLTSAAAKDLTVDDDSFSSMSVEQLQSLIDEQIEKRLADRTQSNSPLSPKKRNPRRSPLRVEQLVKELPTKPSKQPRRRKAILHKSESSDR